MLKEPITQYINYYQLKPNIQQNYRITHDILITQDTLNKYLSYHPKNEDYFKKIKTVLQKIRKNEKVVLLDNTKIYFHTYRILFFIDHYINALDFYNSEKYIKYSFAKYKSNSNKVEREYFKLQKQSFDPYLFTGSNKLEKKILELFLARKELVDLVLNHYTLFPQGNINYDSINDGDKTLKIDVKRIFSHFASTYISSEDVILKSLTIVLYAYMTLQMKMDSSHAKKIVQELLFTLFNFEFETVSTKKIYIAGRLDNFPIFKNSSKDLIYSNELKKDFEVFTKYIQRGFSDLGELNLDVNDFFNENPIHTYFYQYPVEFLDKID